jgi:hypothetical protein
VVLGKYMRFLLIVLDLCLLAYMVSSMINQILPVREPVFWIGAAVEIGLAFFAYRYWMHSRQSPSWSNAKTLSLVLIIIAIFWPIIIRYSNLDFLQSAAPSDLLFFWAALTLLIYSSFVIKNLPKAGKSRP